MAAGSAIAGGVAAGIGAQAQVGAEHVAVGVARLHQRNEAAGYSRCEVGHRMAIAAFRVYCRRRVVEQHEVHIRRVIQFAGAELAHAEHRESAAAGRVRRIGQAQLARIVRGPQQVRHGEGQRRLGERR